MDVLVSLEGFFGREFSASLPGPNGQTSRTYQWTQSSSSMELWPRIPASSVLTLEYLDPQVDGQVYVTTGPTSALHIPPAPTLRTASLLLQGGEQTIGLLQRKPAIAGGRSLGLIVSDLRCHSLHSARVIPLSSSILLGLPLTLILFGLLAALLNLSRWGYLLAAGLVLGVALLSVWMPWESRAFQPVLQVVFGSALIGAATRVLARRPPAWRWFHLIVAVWALTTLLFFSPTIQHDGAGYYAYLRSFFVDGDIDFADEFDPARTPLRVPDFTGISTITGHTPNPWSVGPALIWSPFWLIAHVVVRLGRLVGFGWQPDGYATPYVVLVMLGSALGGLATLTGCFVLVRRWFAPALSAVTAITIYLGSNLLYYALFDGSFAHSISAATTTWFVLAVIWLDEEPDWWHWTLAGLLGGVMLVVYWISAFLLMVAGVVFLRVSRRQGLRQTLPRMLWAAFLVLLLFSPQMLVWKILYGNWLTVPQGEAFISPRTLYLGSLLMSPLHGLAWWTPAYFVGLVGCTWFAVRRPWPGSVMLVAVTAFTLYNASLPDWHGSGAFGMRRLTVVTPILALGLATVLDSLRRRPAWQLAIAGALSGWGLQMTARYAMFMIPHDVNVLGDLPLRALLFRPVSVPIGALLQSVSLSWIGKLARSPRLDNMVILLACLCLVGLMLVVGRRRWATRVIRI